MKMQTSVNAILLVLLTLSFCISAAGATGTGTVSVTDNTEIQQGQQANAEVWFSNDFSPKTGSFTFAVYFDEAVTEAVDVSAEGTFQLPPVKSSGMIFAGATGTGYSNTVPFWVANVTFRALKNDGSATPVGIVLITLDDTNGDDVIPSTTVINGTFKTKDEVPPVITLTTPTSVSSTFNIAGTIRDVGGMGTAQATLKNATHPAVVYDLLPLGGQAPDYTFSKQVTWPVEDGVTLTVTATDAAGNTGTATQVINVVDVGFSKPEPTGYINVKPAEARVFMSQMNKGTVGMILGSATYGPIPLAIDTTTDYAKGTMPPVLPDGGYWVNASGIDIFGDARYLNWTFTLDTVAPVINTFTVADSDGDGYIEAGETLTLNWNVASDPNFDRVALVDVAKGNELWSSASLIGTATIPPIDDGNRDLAFRAYDKAGNYGNRVFHLYNDYMIWVNSTKMGTFVGIDTTYIGVKDISRTAVSSITLYGGTVSLPTMDTLAKAVTNVGQVTPDIYVTVDNNANRTIAGNETYRNVWVLDPGASLDFLVEVPHVKSATLVLVEANETYIAELIEGGKGGMHSINYDALLKETAYIFINGGWTKIVVADDGTISMPDQSGIPITNPGNISETLRHPANQVDLNAGYRLNDQNLKSIKPAPGDYVLATIAMDGDRIGFLGMMPVIVMESNDQGAITPTSVQQNATFTAQFRFDTPCERLGVIVLRDVAYSGTALIDAATLGKETLFLNFTYNGIPATQKLIGNIYVSPSSGKYVMANTNQAVISTSGLDPGSYRVYMVGQSANGTIQAYGQHMLTITSPVPPTPVPPSPSGGGGGGSGSTVSTYTGTGTLLTSSAGTVLKSVMVNAADNIASLFIPIGTKALDANGKPLGEIGLKPLAGDAVPAVPSGSVFKFAGYAYEASPDGATFDPAITLSLDIPEDVWNSLDLTNQQCMMKWYNKESGLWEDVPTTIIPGTRTIEIRITHFSIYALFTEPITTPTTPTETVTTAAPATPTTPTAPPAEGLPMTMILAIFAVIAIVVVAGYFLMMRK